MIATKKVFEEILNDEFLTQEFLKLESVQEMYEFCKERDENVSQEEFDEFIANCLEDFFEYYTDEENTKLDESEFESIAGGAGTVCNKALVSVLSALTLGSSASFGSAQAAVVNSHSKSTEVNIKRVKNRLKLASSVIDLISSLIKLNEVGGFKKISKAVSSLGKKIADSAEKVVLPAMVIVSVWYFCKCYKDSTFTEERNSRNCHGFTFYGSDMYFNYPTEFTNQAINNESKFKIDNAKATTKSVDTAGSDNRVKNEPVKPNETIGDELKRRFQEPNKGLRHVGDSKK